MKSKELMRLYRDGRRDFRRENLQGESFRDQTLSGADFSGAKIQGANFTNAILREANFTKSKAGLQKRWLTVMWLSASLFSAFVGFTSALDGYFIVYFFLPSGDQDIVLGLLVLVVHTILFIVTLWKGTEIASRLLPPFIFIIAILAVTGIGAVGISIAITTAVAIVFVIVGAVVFAFIGAFSNGKTVSAFTAISIISAAIFTITGIVSKAFTIAFTLALPNINAITGISTTAIILTALDAFIILGLSFYVAWQALKNNDKFTLIRAFAIIFSSINGTRFYGADLTGSNFTNAIIRNTDFRIAELGNVYWANAYKIDLARVGSQYLQYSLIRQLVTTLQGQKQSFDRLILSGINLKSANLQDTSFIGANLDNANLQEVDLSRAVLKQTQLDSADLTGVNLTGACIEDWGITADTILDEIECHYIFMRLHSQDDPDRRRKPDNWNKYFEVGEFSDFIAPMVQTLDLYHNQTFDPRAFAIAFNELCEAYPETPLDIISIEKKGKRRDKILVKVESNKQANYSKLHENYFERYDQIVALPPKALVELIAQRDREISRLVELADTAINTPSINIQNVQGNVGEIMTDNNRANYDLRSANIGNLADTVKDNARQQANQYNYESPEKQSLSEAAAEIQRLLKVLEETNPTATEADQKAFVSAGVSPTMKQRAVGALQAGGKAALQEFLDNPYVNVGVAIVEGWREAK